MLGVIHDGVAYPLIWEMLEKKGNSHSEERMDLLDRFDRIFPNAQIAYICGEREFVGQNWLSYLLIEPQIRFRLRIRHSDKISNGKQKLRASVVFAHLLPGQSQVLSGRRWVWGRSVYVAGLRLEKNMVVKLKGGAIAPDRCRATALDAFASASLWSRLFALSGH